VTVVAEQSPACGQEGRVCHVFWRRALPWILMRCHNGTLLPLPWSWTNLPLPLLADAAADGAAPLLAPATLRDLLRFLDRASRLPPRPPAGPQPEPPEVSE
jgi:hypothetical protein